MQVASSVYKIPAFLSTAKSNFDVIFLETANPMTSNQNSEPLSGSQKPSTNTQLCSRTSCSTTGTMRCARCKLSTYCSKTAKSRTGATATRTNVAPKFPPTPWTTTYSDSSSSPSTSPRRPSFASSPAPQMLLSLNCIALCK